MFNMNPMPWLDMALARHHAEPGKDSARAWRTALALYRRARQRSWWHRLGSWLLRRPCHLLDLEEATRDLVPHGEHYTGVRTVPLREIRGSEGRSREFDDEFNPLQTRTEQRWVAVAAAMCAGSSLPPVTLVQVGRIYFVRDGHHRISAARALRQESIEAEIIVRLSPEPEPYSVGPIAPAASVA